MCQPDDYQVVAKRMNMQEMTYFCNRLIGSVLPPDVKETES